MLVVSVGIMLAVIIYNTFTAIFIHRMPKLLSLNTMLFLNLIEIIAINITVLALAFAIGLITGDTDLWNFCVWGIDFLRIGK